MSKNQLVIVVLEHDSTSAAAAASILDAHGHEALHEAVVLLDARLTRCMSQAFAEKLLTQIDAHGVNRVLLLGTSGIRSGFRSMAWRMQPAAGVAVPSAVDDLPAFLNAAQMEEFLQCEMEIESLTQANVLNSPVFNEDERLALLASMRSLPSHSMPEQACLVSAGAHG